MSCDVDGFCDEAGPFSYPCLAPVRSVYGGRRGRQVGKGVAEKALRHADLVQVLRDPAEEERPAGPEQQARVDIGRFRDDAFLEQDVDLVGHRLEDVLDDLLACARRSFDDDRLAAVGDRRQCR